MKTTIKIAFIATIAMMEISLGINAQITDTGGNVGIGTTDPKEKLHVNGSVRGHIGTGALRVQTSNGYIDVGARNYSWAHIYTDRPNIIFNKDVYTLTNAFSSYNNDLILKTQGSEKLRIKNTNGYVGIGTTNPDMELTVNGKIHAKEVKIDLDIPAPDYVFKSDYKLRSIEEVENFIKENSHLPEIPSAKEFAENGVMQAEMDMNLLKKIEELTLYTIEQEKKLKSQKSEIQELKKQNFKIEEQEKKIERLESLVEKLLKDKN